MRARFAQALRQVAWLVVACVSWLALPAQAQVALGTQDGRIDLWPHVRILTDPDRVLNADQALAALPKFSTPGGAYATLGMDKQVVWLHVPVNVTGGGQGAWVLDIDYALLHRVDVYLMREGRVARQATLGNTQPFAARPLKSRSHAASLEFTAQGPADLLLRVDTPGAKILPVSLARVSTFHARALDEQLVQGALGGLALVLLLYSLAQWASLRENIYLKYALLVFCSAMFSIHFFGIGEMYLWTDGVWFERHMAGITSLMAAAATALFVEDAMGDDLLPSLRQALKAVAAIHGVATILHGLDVIDIQTVAIFMTTTGLAPALMGIPGAIAKSRRGDSVGGWFIVAWVGYFLASAIMVGVVRGRIDVNYFTMHSFQIGATLDMLIFMRIAVLRTAARHRDAQRAAQERDQLHSLAHSDPLTGLLNRRGLDDFLAAAFARATPGRVLALYMLDLDGFKPVNDRFGHDVGDEVLRVIAQRLRASVRAGDGVARVGGDEFVVLADGLTTEVQALDLGYKLVDAFKAPITIGAQSFTVSATIGFALAPPDANDASALLKAADASMYTGKQEGKGQLLRAGAAT